MSVESSMIDGLPGSSTSRRRPIAVDLFAGAGGLSLGLEQAGFDVVAAVEYDPVHSAVHKYNFPQATVLCADVAAPLEAGTLVEAVEQGLAHHSHDPATWDREIDLIAGGPPCQGFSAIGKRLLDDERNRLVFHFLRIVAELQPRYFVMENVPGMARGGHAGILQELIAEFEEAGYHFGDHDPYRVLNAAEYGVPQERHRLFLIGSRGDQPAAQPPSPTFQPVPKRSTGARPMPSDTSLPLGPTVWDAIGDLPDLDRYPSLRSSDAVTLRHDTFVRMEEMASGYARRLRGLEPDVDDLSRPRGWCRQLLTGSARTEHTEKSRRRFRDTASGATEPNSRFYKLDRHGLCNTLRAGSGSERGAFTSPRPIHPVRNRVLSNREAARLHSFPDWFRLHTTKWHGFRQIGNSVAPLVGRAVGAQIVKALNLKPPKPDVTVPLGEVGLLTLTMSEATRHFGVDTASIPRKRTRGASVVPPSRIEAQMEFAGV